MASVTVSNTTFSMSHGSVGYVGHVATTGSQQPEKPGIKHPHMGATKGNHTAMTTDRKWSVRSVLHAPKGLPLLAPTVTQEAKSGVEESKESKEPKAPKDATAAEIPEIPEKAPKIPMESATERSKIVSGDLIQSQSPDMIGSNAPRVGSSKDVLRLSDPRFVLKRSEKSLDLALQNAEHAEHAEHAEDAKDAEDAEAEASTSNPVEKMKADRTDSPRQLSQLSPRTRPVLASTRTSSASEERGNLAGAGMKSAKDKFGSILSFTKFKPKDAMMGSPGRDVPSELEQHGGALLQRMQQSSTPSTDVPKKPLSPKDPSGLERLETAHGTSGLSEQLDPPHHAGAPTHAGAPAHDEFGACTSME